MFPELWVHVGGGIDTQPHDGQEGWSSDPAAVLAWAVRNAGRERVVPIIERTLMGHERSTDYRLTAEDVFATIKEAGDGAN